MLKGPLVGSIRETDRRKENVETKASLKSLLVGSVHETRAAGLLGHLGVTEKPARGLSSRDRNRVLQVQKVEKPARGLDSRDRLACFERMNGLLMGLIHEILRVRARMHNTYQVEKPARGLDSRNISHLPDSQVGDGLKSPLVGLTRETCISIVVSK